MKAQALQSPHILTRVRRLANNLMESHGGVQAVRDFYEETQATGETH